LDDTEEEGAKVLLQMSKPEVGPLKLTAEAAKEAVDEEAVAAPCTLPLRIK
jgi:hypothetical protein